MANVSVFRWDDVGAPQILTGKPSEIFSILKAVLVDGYGSKQALGWSVSYESSNPLAIIFKNNTLLGGSGSEIKFRAATNQDPENGVIFGSSAYYFTDINNAYRQSGEHAFNAKVGVRAWIIIGNASGFYLIMSAHRQFINNPISKMAGVGSSSVHAYFGDFKSVFSNDPGRCIAIASYRASNSSVGDSLTENLGRIFYSSNMSSSGGESLLLYDADNTSESAGYALASPFTQSNGISGLTPGEHPITGAVLLILTGRTVTTAELLNGVSYGSSLKRPSVRGHMPGLIQTSRPGYGHLEWPQFVEVNGQSHIILSNYHNADCTFLLNMEEW